MTLTAADVGVLFDIAVIAALVFLVYAAEQRHNNHDEGRR